MGTGSHQRGKRRAVIRHGAVAQPECADRHAAAHAFGPGNAVRLDLRGDHAPCHRVAAAAEAGLHLVEHQQQVVLLAKRGHGTEEFRRRGDDAALALHRLQQDGGGLRAHAVLQRGDVVEWQVAEARQHRIEAILDLRLAGGGHRAERAAVEGLQEGDHLEALHAIRLRALAAEAARGFDEPVIRLGTGVREENLAGELDVVGVDFLRQLGLQRVLIEIGNMHQLARLMADGFDQSRVAMPERADGDAHAEVQIALPGLVPQAAARAPHRHQREAAVGREDVLGVELGCGHDFAGKGAEASRLPEDGNAGHSTSRPQLSGRKSRLPVIPRFHPGAERRRGRRPGSP